MATLTKANKFSLVSLERHFGRVYSSGSVQDLHLIPFSPQSANADRDTKTENKGIDILLEKNKIRLISYEEVLYVSG